MRRCQQGTDKGGHREYPIIPLRFPGVDETGDIEQPDYRHHDHRRQDRLWQIVEQWGEEKQDHPNGNARENAGQPRYRAGLQVDRRSRERARNRKTLARRAENIGQPLTDQLLVRIEALSSLGRHGLGDGDGLHKTEQGNDGGDGQKMQYHLQIQPRDRERRQTLGHLPHNAPATSHDDCLRIKRTVSHPQSPDHPSILPTLWEFPLEVEHTLTVGSHYRLKEQLTQSFPTDVGLFLQFLHPGAQDQGLILQLQDPGRVRTALLLCITDLRTESRPVSSELVDFGDRAIEIDDQLPHLGNSDGIEGCFGILFISRSPGNEGGDHHRNQDVRDSGIEAAQPVHDTEGQHSQPQGRPVGEMDRRFEDPVNRLVMVSRFIDVHVKHF